MRTENWKLSSPADFPVTRPLSLLLLALVILAPPLRAEPNDTAAKKQLRGETIILIGGPALRKWENLRPEGDRHDRWWANFVSSANLRTKQLISQGVAPDSIVWLVPRNDYSARQREDGKPYPAWINRLANKNGVRIQWFSTSSEILRYFRKGRSRSSMPIVRFEYFGHSNKHAFMIDYSNRLSGASMVYIHERDLKMFSRRWFHRDAYIKSWGCHTGESFSKVWKREVGVPM